MKINNQSQSPKFGQETPPAAIDIPTFCRMFSIGKTLVYSEIKAGRLKIKKAGRRTLISSQAAHEWFNSLQTKTN